MKLPELKEFLLRRIAEKTGDAEFMAGQRRMAEMLPMELQRYAPFLVFNGITGQCDVLLSPPIVTQRTVAGLHSGERIS
jgi:hypothetical protein